MTSELETRLRGALRAGAELYAESPRSWGELESRVRAVRRRRAVLTAVPVISVAASVGAVVGLITLPDDGGRDGGGVAAAPPPAAVSGPLTTLREQVALNPPAWDSVVFPHPDAKGKSVRLWLSRTPGDPGRYRLCGSQGDVYAECSVPIPLQDAGKPARRTGDNALILRAADRTIRNEEKVAWGIAEGRVTSLNVFTTAGQKIVGALKFDAKSGQTLWVVRMPLTVRGTTYVFADVTKREVARFTVDEGEFCPLGQAPISAGVSLAGGDTLYYRGRSCAELRRKGAVAAAYSWGSLREPLTAALKRPHVMRVGEGTAWYGVTSMPAARIGLISGARKSKTVRTVDDPWGEKLKIFSGHLPPGFTMRPGVIVAGYNESGREIWRTTL
ncbi:hypothetical protein SAMN05421505_101333 [Sinosporangium album]|uniref:Uncharacterized protein n=1 Tax=Sinosporangium album TaxID=504805 RepID=A0A1G7RB34_9ACTN|nr:hypothetical protein [Sinosporangium album]SDG07933.1 hypothetical protein SAMN05421505_101333 [Sinosporangium album]